MAHIRPIGAMADPQSQTHALRGQFGGHFGGDFEFGV